MKIIAHRGLWKVAPQKNTIEAFRLAFENGFGIETDVRDLNGKLVISHDLPTLSSPALDDMLALAKNYKNISLAINIKSDGLAHALARKIADNCISDWFVFDMSIPDTLSQLTEKNSVFFRLSEFEPISELSFRSSGIWLDAFTHQWYSVGYITQLLEKWKVCIVSPDLHKRPHLPLWQEIKMIASHPNLYICTDHPEDARDFFG